MTHHSPSPWTAPAEHVVPSAGHQSHLEMAKRAADLASGRITASDDVFRAASRPDLGEAGVSKAEMLEGGRKDDAGKPPFELIPPELLFAVAEILAFGARKYEARNWEKGMSWGRVFGALMRHLWAWWAGKGPAAASFLFGSTDDETKRSHLWHAACCIAFLVAFEERGVGQDDRHTTGAR